MSTWPEAVIFDLDGTLVDSAPDMAAALNQLLGELDLPPYEVAVVRTLIGGGVPKLIERALRPHRRTPAEFGGEALVERFMEIYAPRATETSRLYDGVEPELKRLTADGVKCGVCTNKPSGVTHQILEELDIARFMSSVVGGDSGLPKKPDSAPMLRMLGQLGVSADKAVLVGDSRVDVALARAVGMPVIVVSYGYTKTPAAELGGDLLVDGFAQLPAAFTRLADKVGSWA